MFTLFDQLVDSSELIDDPLLHVDLSFELTLSRRLLSLCRCLLVLEEAIPVHDVATELLFLCPLFLGSNKVVACQPFGCVVQNRKLMVDDLLCLSVFLDGIVHH